MGNNSQLKKVIEVFQRFLLLGCTSFGGPVAHLGYFRKVFVEEQKWIDQESYSRLIALSQFLPGPGSSQVGFALGMRHAGIAGGVAAFLGFTLPSFLLLYALALSSDLQQNYPFTEGVVHGLKLFAVVVVADAVLSMQKSFCTERTTLSIAIVTTVCLLAFPSLITQMLVLICAAIAGLVLYRNKTQSEPVQTIPHAGNGYLVLFLLLFLALPLLANYSNWMSLISDFYHSGSLVFGGGHVVLPLLQQNLDGLLDQNTLLFGYSAAQAVPGPMFTLASYLGAELNQENMLAGACLATLAIFLPGFLLLIGLYKRWEIIAQMPKLAGAIWGINASVVGLLLAALYQPVFTSSVSSAIDMAVVVGGFCLLRVFKVPVIFMVLGFSLSGVLLLS